MKLLRVSLTPGLPEAGDLRQFIGQDKDGALWVLSWREREGCWQALGWFYGNPESTEHPVPTLRSLRGPHAGMIVGHVVARRL